MIYNQTGLWTITTSKKVEKELLKLPRWVNLIFRSLLEDLEKEGPYPKGWDSKPLVGTDEIRIRLNREYRVILQVVSPELIVIKVAHRKEAYK